MHLASHRALVQGALVLTIATAASAYEGVVAANSKAPGRNASNQLTRELRQVIAAQGSQPVENPSSVAAAYGYAGDGPMMPAYGDVQTTAHQIEATKTEPDKNTYLVVSGQHGSDPSYDYGTHFLYQGHENAARNAAGARNGHLTRINLDADAAHRVTVMATTDRAGAALPTFDGSTWDPFSQRLLFTAELGNAGGVWAATLDYPSQVDDVSGALGRGGYEGIQADADGNLWIVEDVGGPRGTVNNFARQPNSFVYRFVPATRGDLAHGRLQALQVMSLAHPGPIVFHAGAADADMLSQDVHDLHAYGSVFTTAWVTVHDTAVDGTAPFDANALAKARQATPFKRPENGAFRPGSGFGSFWFAETGDTDLRTQAGSAYGGFGAVFELAQSSPSAATGRLRMRYQCDASHSGFDNLAFWTRDRLVIVEDAGDTLHQQRNALDSAWMLDPDADYANPATPGPVRILAEGRDASATIDSGLAGQPGYQNDGDNEITGLHVSNGDPTSRGLLGAKAPAPFEDGWRVFWTQQHGDNVTWEIVRCGDDGDEYEGDGRD